MPQTSTPLNPRFQGMRIGLSGAVPDPSEWQGRALDWEILNAVTTLADLVFRGDGYLVHGSHPSFTPRIIAQAESYARERGAPVASFVLSGLFADGMLARQLAAARDQGIIRLLLVDPVHPPGHEGQGVEDSAVRNASLTAMRRRLIDEMDALVVIGGKRWAGSEHQPGAPEEVALADARGIPVIPYGGLGGMAEDLSERLLPPNDRSRHPLTDGPAPVPLGLAPAEVEFLRTSTDYSSALGLIARHLAARGR